MPATYEKLLQEFPLRPIRSARELDRAIRVIDTMVDREKLSRAEQDYLEVLSGIVAQYEDAAHPMPALGDDAMLRHLIEARGITQTELARQTGIANSTISAALQGTRRLTREQIGILSSYFRVSPGVFFFQEKPRAARGAKVGRRGRAR